MILCSRAVSRFLSAQLDQKGIQSTVTNVGRFISTGLCRSFPRCPPGVPRGPRIKSDSTSPQPKTIVYSRISPNDIPIVSQHMLSYYFKLEPISVAMDLPLDQVEPWFPKYLAEVLNYYEPVSFMAKDSETGEIIGLSLNIILDPNNRAPPPLMKVHITKEDQPVKWDICSLFDDFEDGVDPVKHLRLDSSTTNKIFSCMFVSVAPHYACRRLATTLIREGEEEARRVGGVTVAMIDATSTFSYLAAKKLGYRPMKELEYKWYKNRESVPIFRGREHKLGIHTHLRLMVKKM